MQEITNLNDDKKKYVKEEKDYIKVPYLYVNGNCINGILDNKITSIEFVLGKVNVKTMDEIIEYEYEGNDIQLEFKIIERG